MKFYIFEEIRKTQSNMSKIKTSILFALFCFSSALNAQYKYGISHELGIAVGPVQFRSDYGQSKNTSTNFGNTGYGIGIVHFLNFAYGGYGNYFEDSYFREHFKIRSEISYNKTDLKHYGEWVEGNSNIGKEKLKGMYGSTRLVNFGTEIQFFPLKEIHDFENTDDSFNPYISFGAQYSLYKATASSTLGPLGTSETTIQKYLDAAPGHAFGFANESKGVFSFVSSVGTRYKLSPMHDLFADMRLQYFYTDWVDGLNPNRGLHPENKTNDWLIWLNVGYVFYLEEL
jgi:hypothetical protein